MPVIDVYAPEDLFPADKERNLAVSLMLAALRAEGFANPSVEIRDLVGTSFHRLPIHTANTAQARVVRIQITAAAGGFHRAGLELFIPEATRLVAEASGDPSQAEPKPSAVASASTVSSSACKRHGLAKRAGRDRQHPRPRDGGRIIRRGLQGLPPVSGLIIMISKSVPKGLPLYLVRGIDTLLVRGVLSVGVVAQRVA